MSAQLEEADAEEADAGVGRRGRRGGSRREKGGGALQQMRAGRSAEFSYFDEKYLMNTGQPRGYFFSIDYDIGSDEENMECFENR